MPLYPIPFPILDALIVAYLHEQDIPCRTEHYNEALHRYHLVSEWGSLGQIQLKKVNPQACVLQVTPPPAVVDGDLLFFTNQFVSWKRQAYLASERQKRPGVPLDVLA